MSESFIVDYYQCSLYGQSYTLKVPNATLKTYDNYFEVKNGDEVLFTVDPRSQEITSKLSNKTGGYNFMFGRNAIQFDKNSEAAANKFKQYLDKIKTKSYTNSYYDSGNLYRMCSTVNKLSEGNGKEFYDDENFTLKYQGEFEKDLYDGEGTLYSKNGKVKLSCKNFSKGKLNGFVTLEITKRDKSVAKKTLKADEIDKLTKDVDEYLFNLASKYYPNFKQEVSTIDEQLYIITKQLQQIKETQDDLLNALKEDFLLKLSVVALSGLTLVSYFM